MCKSIQCEGVFVFKNEQLNGEGCSPYVCGITVSSWHAAVLTGKDRWSPPLYFSAQQEGHYIWISLLYQWNRGPVMCKTGCSTLTSLSEMGQDKKEESPEYSCYVCLSQLVTMTESTQLKNKLRTLWKWCCLTRPPHFKHNAEQSAFHLKKSNYRKRPVLRLAGRRGRRHCVPEVFKSCVVQGWQKRTEQWLRGNTFHPTDKPLKRHRKRRNLKR